MRIDDPNSSDSFYRKRRRRFDGQRTARALTFSCFQRLPLLAKDRSREWFVEALQAARTKYPVDLWAWVIMPEHVHLLVCPRDAGPLVGTFQGFLKERVARQAMRWLEQHEPVWLERLTVIEGVTTRRRFGQPGGGYDRNLETHDVILATIDYLHLNPVRRGLVERAVDWEWSSAKWYAGETGCKLELDRTLPMMDE